MTRRRLSALVLCALAGVCYAEHSGGTPYCFSNMMSFSQYGTCPVRGGDSGAPFYLNFSFGGYPYIRGMVTAYSANACFGERWAILSSAFGLTIVTG